MGSRVWMVRVAKVSGGWTEWRCSAATTTAKRASEEAAEHQWNRDSPDYQDSYKVEVRRAGSDDVECFVVDVEARPDFVSRKVEVPGG